MTTLHQSAGTTAVDAVLGALERLAEDLRRRTAEAESRAEAAERRLEQERESRHGAEARAAAAEQAAQEALRRAEAMEAATRQDIDQLRRDLLAAIREAGDTAQAKAPAREAAEAHRIAEEPQDTPPRAARERELAYISEPAAGRGAGAEEPASRRWSREERGYAWVEDDPGPPWWRRIFGRHY